MSFCGGAAAGEEEVSGALLGGGAARSHEPQHAHGNGLAVGGLSYGDSRYVG